MEICYQTIHNFKVIWWITKKFCFPFLWDKFACFSSTFKSSNTCCANGNNPSSFLLCFIYYLGGFRRHFIVFTMHIVFQDIIFLDRSKCPQPYVKKDKTNYNPHILYFLQKFVRKMQASRWGSR